MKLVMLAGALIVSVNGAVRLFGGGAPQLLSPFHMKDKLRALGALVAHLPRHVLDGACEGRPASAVRASARAHAVPEALALAVARTESSLQTHAISHAGAMGLMQLMPDTARHMKVEDPFDPRQSADGGVRYLAWLLRRYRGDRVRALAGYNAGPYAVPKQGKLRLPAETRAYVRKVQSRVDRRGGR